MRAETASSGLVSAFGVASLSALAVGSALAIGTVHVPVLLCVSALAILASSVLLFIERSVVRRLPGPALVLLGLALFTAVQAIPLPLSWLAIIAPHNADVWARALRPFGEPPLRSGSVSLDPGASWVEALKWFTYALVFTMASRVGRAASFKIGLGIAFGSAVTVALVTLAHALTGATSLYGIYTPEVVTLRWGLSPILNPNNLSGYLNLGVFCGLGLLLANRTGETPSAKWILIAAGITVLVSVSVLGASRGGVLGLGAGVLILAALLAIAKRKGRQTGRDEARSGAMVPVAIAIGGGLVLALVGASSATWGELKDTSTEKFRLWEWSLPLVRDFPWLGVGRGAFGTIFPAYRGVSGNIVFTHAENFVLQWATEWGIPVAVAALGALAWMCRPRSATLLLDRARLVAIVGVLVLLLQNLVDLALEIPAVAILMAIVLGSLWEEPLRAPAAEAEGGAVFMRRFRRLRRKLLGRSGRRALAYGVFAAGALSFSAAFAWGRHPVDDERQELHQIYERTAFKDQAAFADFRDRLRQAVLRRPAEPYFPLLGALAAERTRGVNVMPWVVAALERDAMNGRAHLVLASVLMRNHAVDQGLMELRFAAQDEPALAGPAGQMAARLTNDLEKLDRAVPAGPTGSGMFLSAAGVVSGDDAAELRSKLLDLAVARSPIYIPARLARAREALSALAKGSIPCSADSRSACIGRIREEAEAIRKLDGNSCEPLLLRAQADAAEPDYAKAERLLADECPACSDKASCWGLRLSMAAQLPSSSTLVVAGRDYLNVVCTSDEPCLGAHMAIGDQLAARGLWTMAMDHYQEAASRSRNAEWWLRTADASLHAGQVLRASLALLRARRDGAGDNALEARINTIQTQIDDRQPLR